MAHAESIVRSTHGDSLADVLERVLETGVVIVGDIRVKVADIELLSIQLRLLICSVEKARQLGIPWWWDGQPRMSEKAATKPLPASDHATGDRSDHATSDTPDHQSAPSDQTSPRCVQPAAPQTRETTNRPQKSAPQPPPETRTAWHEYQRFQEFKRFQAAMRALEHWPG